MKEKPKNIKIGLATEEQVNKEFIEAWHRAEKDETKVPEERLYFLDPATFFRVLSKGRIALLQALHSHGSTSIRHLSKVLKRDYKNVHHDVTLLKQVGLICQDKSGKIYVPYDKINAEIPLAA